MISAHGLGGGSDLPIPASFAIAGGTAALTLSFVVLLAAWRTPRFNNDRHERALPGHVTRVLDGVTWARTWRTVGMLFFAFVAAAAVFGKDLLTNPTFGVVYVWLWVGIVPASLLFGPFFKAVSPARTLHLLLSRLMRVPPKRGQWAYPERLGYWPAALGLLAFVWLELVSPQSTYLGPVRLWFALYLGAMMVGSALFGNSWLARADPFEVYSTLVGHLSIWSRDSAGRLVLASPLRNLARLTGPPAGLVAVVAVLLGSTAFDSWREAPTWVRFVQTSSWSITVLNTGMLLIAVLVVGLVFVAATRSTGVDRARSSPSELPARLAHSIVPIVVGYMIAHYLSYFVEVGQTTLILASDPFGTGANLLGAADWKVNYWLSLHPSLLATIKVLAIVTGHVLGVIAAHDRSLQLLPRRHQVSGQLPLLFAMVLYTFMGLYLLFGA